MTIPRPSLGLVASCLCFILGYHIHLVTAVLVTGDGCACADFQEGYTEAK